VPSGEILHRIRVHFKKLRYTCEMYEPLYGTRMTAFLPELKAAQEALVLLQNRDDLLPLDKKALKRVAVIGPHADVVTLNNYNGKVKDAVNALQGLKSRAPGIEFTFALGGEIAPRAGARTRRRPSSISRPSFRRRSRRRRPPRSRWSSSAPTPPSSRRAGTGRRLPCRATRRSWSRPSPRSTPGRSWC